MNESCSGSLACAQDEHQGYPCARAVGNNVRPLRREIETQAHRHNKISSPNTSLLNNETTSINAHETKPRDDAGHAIDYRKPTRGLHSKLLNFLRQFRLQSIFPGSNCERRKVAIHRNRIVAAAYSSLHVTPLAGAITLLVLQWTNYWVSSTDDYASMLQFAAKGLELAMQASIIEILLGLVRTGLVDDLLPLGTLSAAIQPTQLSFLWSLDYLSCFRSRAFRSWQKVVFVVAIPVLIALTALVGPSSAVLMIPRAGTSHLLGNITLRGVEPTAISYPQNLSVTRFDMYVLLSIEICSAKPVAVICNNLTKLYFILSHKASMLFVHMTVG